MYIVITQPWFFAGEAEAITLMFQAGLERLHLRKPESSAEECRWVLDSIPQCYHKRIVLHEHFELLGEYDLCGVHLNRRNPKAPEGWGGHVSVSCHSIDELAERKKENYAYLSLSPIFDSISKTGYNAAFAEEELKTAREEGIIDERVMALGGICHDNVDEALGYGFGGVMVLGDAWRGNFVQKEKTKTKRESDLPVVLSIAGSDSSAGAGIQQDLKTMTNCGCYGATVITALTSQNTLGVQGVMAVPAEVVESQMRSVFDDMRVEAVKIGMIPNVDVARVIVKVLREERAKRTLPVVCDPIMLSTSGTRLMSEECIAFVHKELFPLCTLVTPNIPEHDYLLSHGLDIATNLLLKGGHAEGTEMTDTLFLHDEGWDVKFSSPRIETKNLHGTGCTLSSAIASHLARGCSLATAVERAKRYMDKAILGGRDLRIGKGNGPLFIIH